MPNTKVRNNEPEFVVTVPQHLTLDVVKLADIALAGDVEARCQSNLSRGSAEAKNSLHHHDA